MDQGARVRAAASEMDQPVKEITNVVRALCQGSPKEQADTLDTHFLPDASFVHPLCRVPSFSGVHVPLLGEVNSRMLILAIFKWYNILSPKIDVKIDSSVLDQRNNLLYLTIRQTFSIWFVPFYKASVRLVTVLHLAQCPLSDYGQVVLPATRSAVIKSKKANDEGGASYAAVASVSSSTTTPNTKIGGRTRYMISCQEDLYQINDILTFLFPWAAGSLWFLFQVFNTLLCTIGAVVGTSASAHTENAETMPKGLAGMVRKFRTSTLRHNDHASSQQKEK